MHGPKLNGRLAGFDSNVYRAMLKAIATETGKVIDDFTIKKVANYAPNLAARNAFLYSGYQPNYKPTFLEASPHCTPKSFVFGGSRI